MQPPPPAPRPKPPASFEGMYGITGPTANFAWMGLHLWYLLLLFLFSVLTLPLLRALQGPGARRVAAAAGRVLAMWSSVVAGLYLAGRYLSGYRPALRYWNEALMPFYTLQQPVIVVLGFFMREWALPPVVKFVPLVPVAFAIIMGLFHFVVRPVKPLRLLFGIK